MADAKAAVGRAHAGFLKWRSVPAPRRGELVRLLGEELRAAKAELGRLVTIEVGKIESEGLGEVQEMIDICDFAVGLSRQLYGLTIAVRAPRSQLMEAGIRSASVGVISAFNFPVAVWSWNAALAFVCGDAVVWKPSEKTPLTALAVEALLPTRGGQVRRRARRPADGADRRPRRSARRWSTIARVPLVSATGSTAHGPRSSASGWRAASPARILELGGNNATIVSPSADLDLALRAVAFARHGHRRPALHVAAPPDRA